MNGILLEGPWERFSWLDASGLVNIQFPHQLWCLMLDVWCFGTSNKVDVLEQIPALELSRGALNRFGVSLTVWPWKGLMGGVFSRESCLFNVAWVSLTTHYSQARKEIIYNINNHLQLDSPTGLQGHIVLTAHWQRQLYNWGISKNGSGARGKHLPTGFRTSKIFLSLPLPLY